MVRVGDGPAPDELSFRVLGIRACYFLELGVGEQGGHGERQVACTHADGQPCVGITHLLTEDDAGHGVHVLHVPAHGPRYAGPVKAELARLPDDVPQYGALCAHVRRVCKLVERQPCRAHDFRPELSHHISEEALLFR